MTNHVHLVATPVREDSLAKAVGRTHLAYAQYVNRLYGRSGHLWQNRFYSCLLDEDHYWAALRYVERNPVRARLVRLPWRYPWSSAAVHTGRAEPTGLLNAPQWRREISPKEWEQVLTEADDEEMVRMLRIRAQTGRPLASDRFMSKVEAFLGRRVRPLPVGGSKKSLGKSEEQDPQNIREFEAQIVPIKAVKLSQGHGSRANRVTANPPAQNVRAKTECA